MIYTLDPFRMHACKLEQRPTVAIFFGKLYLPPVHSHLLAGILTIFSFIYSLSLYSHTHIYISIYTSHPAIHQRIFISNIGFFGFEYKCFIQERQIQEVTDELKNADEQIYDVTVEGNVSTPPIDDRYVCHNRILTL